MVVGKPKFVAESAAGVVETELASGELAIYVGVAGEFAGALVMSDPIRREARRTLTELESMGVTRTVMLTGDALATAEHIADEAGLTDVRAECLPPDKVEAVRSLPLRPVMMVGDGVNDAPVLAVADVGIAMGARGSTAAGESADVVIILDDLSKVASAVRIGQRTVKVALQSIWIGIALSVALMVAAAAGYVPAIAGALSQELVDLATILNALRALSAGKKGAGTKGPDTRAKGQKAAAALPGRCLFLGFRDPRNSPEVAVRVQRDRVDALADQERRELRVVAGTLAADADLDPGGVGLADGLADHRHHGLVPLVEECGQLRRIPVHAQDQLGEVVGADGEAVEAGGELLGEDHVGRDLAHHVDLQAVLAPDQAVLRHDGQHPVRFLRGPAERDHHDDVAEAELLPDPLEGHALEGEALAVALVVVAGGAAEAEHRVLLRLLEGGAADQVRVLVAS